MTILELTDDEQQYLTFGHAITDLRKFIDDPTHYFAHTDFDFFEEKVRKATNANKKIALVRQLLAELERTQQDTQEYLKTLTGE
tara:strand:- start:129 stop:380 length:252 start_codon:yes stop_codon:yes gene_type:complete